MRVVNRYYLTSSGLFATFDYSLFLGSDIHFMISVIISICVAISQPHISHKLQQSSAYPASTSDSKLKSSFSLLNLFFFFFLYILF